MTSLFELLSSYMLLVTTSISKSKTSRDLFVTLPTLCPCLSYMYLVATPIISVATFYLHQYRIFSSDRKTGSRPQLILLAFLMVATPILFVATISLSPVSISGRDHKMVSRPYGCFFFFLVGFCLNCLIVVATSDLND